MFYKILKLNIAQLIISTFIALTIIKASDNNNHFSYESLLMEINRDQDNSVQDNKDQDNSVQDNKDQDNSVQINDKYVQKELKSLMKKVATQDSRIKGLISRITKNQDKKVQNNYIKDLPNDIFFAYLYIATMVPYKKLKGYNSETILMYIANNKLVNTGPVKWNELNENQLEQLVKDTRNIINHHYSFLAKTHKDLCKDSNNKFINNQKSSGEKNEQAILDEVVKKIQENIKKVNINSNNILSENEKKKKISILMEKEKNVRLSHQVRENTLVRYENIYKDLYPLYLGRYVNKWKPSRNIIYFRESITNNSSKDKKILHDMKKYFLEDLVATQEEISSKNQETNKAIKKWKDHKEKFDLLMIKITLQEGAKLTNEKQLVINPNKPNYLNSKIKEFIIAYKNYLDAENKLGNNTFQKQEAKNHLQELNHFFNNKKYEFNKDKENSIISIMKKKVGEYSKLLVKEFQNIKDLLPQLSPENLLAIFTPPLIEKNYKKGIEVIHINKNDQDYIAFLSELYQNIKLKIPKTDDENGRLVIDINKILFKIKNRNTDILNSLKEIKAKSSNGTSILNILKNEYIQPYITLNRMVNDMVYKIDNKQALSNYDKNKYPELQKIKEYIEKQEKQIKDNQNKQEIENKDEKNNTQDVNYQKLASKIIDFIKGKKVKESNFLGPNTQQIIQTKNKQDKGVTDDIIQIIKNQEKNNNSSLKVDEKEKLIKVRNVENKKIKDSITNIIEEGSLKDNQKNFLGKETEKTVNLILKETKLIKNVIETISNLEDSNNPTDKVIEVLKKFKKEKIGSLLSPNENKKIGNNIIEIMQGKEAGLPNPLGDKNTSEIKKAMKDRIKNIAINLKKLINNETFDENFLGDHTNTIKKTMEKRMQKILEDVIQVVKDPNSTITLFDDKLEELIKKKIVENYATKNNKIVKALDTLVKLAQEGNQSSEQTQSLLANTPFIELVPTINSLSQASPEKSKLTKQESKLQEKKLQLQGKIDSIKQIKQQITQKKKELEEENKKIQNKEEKLLKSQQELTKIDQEKATKDSTLVDQNWKFTSIAILITISLQIVVGTTYMFLTNGKKETLQNS